MHKGSIFGIGSGATTDRLCQAAAATVLLIGGFAMVSPTQSARAQEGFLQTGPEFARNLEDIRQSCHGEIASAGFNGADEPVSWRPLPNDQNGGVVGNLATADNIAYFAHFNEDYYRNLRTPDIQAYLEHPTPHITYGPEKPITAPFAAALSCSFKRMLCRAGRTNYCSDGAPAKGSIASTPSSGGAQPQGPLELQNMPARDEPAQRPKDDEVPVVQVDAEYSGKNCIGITVARRYWTDSRHLTITAELKVRNICGVPIHTHVMVKREGLSHLEEIMQMGSDVLPPGSHGWVGPLPALGFAPVYPGTDFLLANSVVDATERAERDKSGNWWIHFATASCDAFDKNGHLTAAFRDAELYHIECPTIPAF